jgi:NADH-quinone oxidoreductase subunit J
MSTVFFFLAGIGAVAGAVGVVTLRDPFFAVLALVGHLLSLALLFLLLRSEFVAAVQVVVYAGAVMVLYVFVVAYVGGRDEGDRVVALGERMRGRGPAGASLRLVAGVLAAALLVELLIALLGTGLEAIHTQGAGYGVGGPESQTFGTPAYIGKLFLTRFLLVFEVASFLLLIAAVGGVVLARRRGGIAEDAEGQARLAPLNLPRPPGTGTMVEGVGGSAYAAQERRAQEAAEQSAPLAGAGRPSS